MKKITRVLVNMICLLTLVVVVTGCTEKIDKKAVRQDEDRIVEYIKDKVKLNDNEVIKKIEFKDYEKNSSTGAWHYDVVINDKIELYYTSWREREEVVLSATKEGDINFVENKKNMNESNIEVIYEK